MIHAVNPEVLKRAKAIYPLTKDEFLEIANRFSKMSSFITGEETAHEFDAELKGGKSTLVQAATLLLCGHDNIVTGDHALTPTDTGNVVKANNFEDIVLVIANSL